MTPSVAMGRTRTLPGALCAGATAVLGLLWPARFDASLVRADPRDPFREADAIDALGLARLADEAGDAALLKALEAPTIRERAVLAARAAPAAHAPEQLVPALVGLACGRDPVLAPEAALALAEIAHTMQPSELAAREVLLSDLRAAQSRVDACVKERQGLRPDIGHALAELSHVLGLLAGPTRE
jgi:hypothetical protein